MAEAQEKPGKPIRGFRKLATSRDIRRATLRVANLLLNGAIEPARGNAVIYALSLSQKCLEAELFEARLDFLEERVGDRAGDVINNGTGRGSDARH